MTTVKPTPPAKATTLEGVLERVTFVREDTGWSVVRLQVPGRAGGVTAVGILAGVEPGEHLKLHGRWVQDRRWGEQFAFDGWTTVTPATLVGIERYLASGLVHGVGGVMAKRLVEHFGLATLDVIDAQPERLVEVAGIGPTRSRQIREAWAAQRALQDVMVFLQAHGVGTAHAVRIYKTYRERAVAVLREDPYRLVLDVPGIGFTTADAIAQRLGVARTSPRRAEAGVLHVLGVLAGEGDLYGGRVRVVERAATLLGVDAVLVEAAIAALAEAGYVVVEDEAVYLHALHTAEVEAADALAALVAAVTPPVALDVGTAIARFEAERGLVLAPAQRRAIEAALAHKVLVITGGPGTGKTTLVNGMLAVLGGPGVRAVLCAPTGRAARRLALAAGRGASTIHRLLEFTPAAGGFQRDRTRPLDADLVVVDEVSMIDQLLFAQLVRALPAPCRLVLVGDVDQLPSVGPGSVLRALIAAGAVPVVALCKIFRQAQESLIVVNAHRVNRGETLRLAGPEDAADFFFVERQEPEEVLATLKHLVIERIPRRFGLDPVEDVQVLTPMHKGLLGAAHLNVELQTLLNPGPPAVERGTRAFRVGDKVMQLRNDYDRDVANGDLGRVVSADAETRTLRVRFDEREVTYEAGELDALALAYACSIHKAQGSEYPAVVLPLHTQHYLLLQRNLLYTAITRGRRLVVVVGSARALALALRTHRTDERATRFAARLAAQVAGETPPA